MVPFVLISSAFHPLPNWLLNFFFLLLLFFQFGGTELWFHILVTDQGCDLFWVEAGGESTGQEVIIGLGFHTRFKKINELAGTASGTKLFYFTSHQI